MAIINKTKLPRRLHVVSGKGGVGKSMFCRSLAWCWGSINGSFVAFDADGSNATLARFLPNTTVVDVDGDGRISAWFERVVMPPLIASETRRVLLDLGSGAERLFRGWAHTNDAPALLREVGVEITVWHLLDPSLDSISPLLDTVSALPDVEHAIVLNLGLAKGIHTYEPAAAFDAIRAEPEYLAVTEGRPVLKMPPLLEAARIDRDDVTFEVAISDKSPLYLFERMRVYRWLHSMRSELAPWV